MVTHQQLLNTITGMYKILISGNKPYRCLYQCQVVTRFYDLDFNPCHLCTQLQPLLTNTVLKSTPKTVWLDVIVFCKTMTHCKQVLLVKVCVLLRLLWITPASNMVNERAFSNVLSVKTYYCVTMNQDRLNHFMILDIYPEHLDTLNLLHRANEDISGNEHRSSTARSSFLYGPV